jgi:hypothetical protein
VSLLSNTIEKSQTLQTSHEIKQNLEHHIHSITNRPEIFAQSPLDFSRNRKLTFETTLKSILSFGGQSLSSELLSYFDFTLQTPTASAFVQVRSKIKIEAFKQLFYRTVPLSNQNKQYKGYQLLAHDGSDINISNDNLPENVTLEYTEEGPIVTVYEEDTTQKNRVARAAVYRWVVGNTST